MIFTIFYLVYFSFLIHHFKFYAISDEYTAKIIKNAIDTYIYSKKNAPTAYKLSFKIGRPPQKTIRAHRIPRHALRYQSLSC